MRRTLPNDDWPTPSAIGRFEEGHSSVVIFVLAVMLTLAGGLFGLVVSSNLAPMGFAVFGICIVFFAIRHPVAAMSLAGITDITCYYISGLTLYPPRIYLVTLVTLASIPRIITLLRNNVLARNIALVFLSIAIISTTVNWATSLEEKILIKKFLSLKIAPALVFLCCAAHTRKRSDFQLIIGTILVATVVSAIFGILQYHKVGVALEAAEFLQSLKKEPSLHTSFRENEPGFGGARSHGLAVSTIDFSYHLVMAYTFVIPMIFFADLSRRTRACAMGMGIILLIATVESLTRSAILAVSVVTVLAAWTRHQPSRVKGGATTRKVVLLVLILATAFGATRSLGGSATDNRIYRYEDDTRTSLYISSLRLIRLYPLGVGRGNIQKTASKHSAEFLDLPVPAALVDTAPHNGFLLITVYWGLPTLAVVLVFLFLLFRFSRTLKAQAPLMPPGYRWLGQMFPLWLGAYIIHCSFHNGFPFTGDMVFWYYIGAICALPNLTQPLAETQLQQATANHHGATPTPQHSPSPVH